MRVTFDHQIFSWQEYGGVSRYFFEIARRIQGFEGYDVEVLSPLFVNKYLKEADGAIKVRGRYIRKIPRSARVIQTANAGVARWILHRSPPDIVHETYYSKTKLAPARTKTVITVYDMIHEKFPQYFHPQDQTGQVKRAAVIRADHVICISENTRSDVIDALGIAREKTSVIYLGRPTIQAGETQEDIAGRPYIAYVGARGGYKNFAGVLRAFAASDLLRTNFGILCFGGGPFTAMERQEIGRAGLGPDRVSQVNGGDDVLGSVYRNAAAFVYPSLYEGFGLPPLEAMAASCPVACSETSSLPEVCGAAAEYFDPAAPESIAASIERAVRSDRRQELITLGLRQIESFSWDECARQTAALYAAIL